MTKGDMNQLETLMNLISKQERLINLSKQDGWKDLLSKLAEFRVDCLSQVLLPGDTTEAKAYARVAGFIVNLFNSIGSDIELSNLMDIKEGVERDIRMGEEIETNQSGQQYSGQQQI
jgi:hypothetical protein